MYRHHYQGESNQEANNNVHRSLILFTLMLQVIRSVAASQKTAFIKCKNFRDIV
jgi:hypothetical protein